MTPSWSRARWSELPGQVFILSSLPEPPSLCPVLGIHVREDVLTAHMELTAQRRRHLVTARYSLDSGGLAGDALSSWRRRGDWGRENGVFRLERWSSALSAQPLWDLC